MDKQDEKVDQMSGIVVGIDGSAHSRWALEWAMKEAAIRRTTLTVITVHEISVGYWGSGLTYPEDHAVAEHARQSAQTEVDKVLADLGEPRPESVTVQSVSGTPAEAILEAAKDADMIVVGSRGAGGFTYLLMGSVSTRVAHRAHCPVVVIPAEHHN
jgi:nucleotide-binding universal stress UspA family protein